MNDSGRVAGGGNLMGKDRQMSVSPRNGEYALALTERVSNEANLMYLHTHPER